MAETAKYWQGPFFSTQSRCRLSTSSHRVSRCLKYLKGSLHPWVSGVLSALCQKPCMKYGKTGFCNKRRVSVGVYALHQRTSRRQETHHDANSDSRFWRAGTDICISHQSNSSPVHNIIENGMLILAMCKLVSRLTQSIASTCTNGFRLSSCRCGLRRSRRSPLQSSRHRSRNINRFWECSN